MSAVPFERRADGPSPFMQVYGLVQAPLGFLRFCEANPEDCRADSDTQARLAASPQRLNELDEINRRVNRLIIPATDLAHYGVAELWALPTDGKGDCEDYALLKRHELLKLGWPSSALLMTVVSDERGKDTLCSLCARRQETLFSTTKSTKCASGMKRPIDFWNGSPPSIRGFGSTLIQRATPPHSLSRGSVPISKLRGSEAEALAAG